jgi:hypothetical protein
MKNPQDFHIIFDILRFGGTPEDISWHTNASRHMVEKHWTRQ